jgi:hypothetical protein
MNNISKCKTCPTFGTPGKCYTCHYESVTLKERIAAETEVKETERRVGRPKKYRKAYKGKRGYSSLKRNFRADYKRALKKPTPTNWYRAEESWDLLREYTKPIKLPSYKRDLEKWLKTFKWRWFGTATFDRRIKTPLSIYEHNVVMGEYSKYLPDGWEPSTWEPSVTTAIQMMEALRHTLEKKSWKRWKLFYVVEEHKDGTPHIHFMMGNDRSGGRDVEVVSRIWRWLRGGYIRLDDIQKSDKAIEYCLKYVTKEAISWDFLTTNTNWLRYKNVPKNVMEFNTFLEMRKHKIHVIKTGKKWYI